MVLWNIGELRLNSKINIDDVIRTSSKLECFWLFLLRQPVLANKFASIVCWNFSFCWMLPLQMVKLSTRKLICLRVLWQGIFKKRIFSFPKEFQSIEYSECWVSSIKKIHHQVSPLKSSPGSKLQLKIKDITNVLTVPFMEKFAVPLVAILARNFLF